MTVSAGYTSNAAGAAGGTGSATATVAPEIAIRSDWAENEANLIIGGSYETFLDGTTAGKPTLNVDANGRLDGQAGWALAHGGRLRLLDAVAVRPELPRRRRQPAGGAQPHRLGGGSTATPGRSSCRWRGWSTGRSTRTEPPAASSCRRATAPTTVFGARARLGYETGAMVAPFVEAEIRRRVFDQTVDDDGLMRSGYVQAYRAGLMIDRAPVLSGEIAVGYLRATFDDVALAALASFVVDGSLTWSPTALTRMTLNAATSVNPSTDPASSGSLAHDASIVFAYDWRSNVTLSGTASLRHESFQGTGLVDRDYKAGLAATWKANRTFYVSGRLEHEWLTSTDSGRNFSSNAAMVEIRLQR